MSGTGEAARGGLGLRSGGHCWGRGARRFPGALRPPRRCAVSREGAQLGRRETAPKHGWGETVAVSGVGAQPELGLEGRGVSFLLRASRGSGSAEAEGYVGLGCCRGERWERERGSGGVPGAPEELPRSFPVPHRRPSGSNLKQ